MNEPADFGRLAAAMLNPPRISVRGPHRNDLDVPDAYELDSIVTTVFRPPRGARGEPVRANPPVVIPAYMVLREGANSPPGLGSSLPFLALIVLGVVLVTIAGLAAIGPWVLP